jgi:CheY-like chemotaxis protein
MDIQLPVLDGYEATRRIKTDPNLKATPVIAVSSFAMKGDEDALRSAAARVLAIAAVHERLYTGEDASVVRLDTFLSDLCG